MFRRPFESLSVKMKSLFKFVFIPSWRRSYIIVRYMHEGLTTQEAMVLAGVIPGN
jgi:hypothetical protein